MEKAIQFYVSYLTAADGGSYLPSAFLSTMKSIVAENGSRHSKMLFKLAVELAMLMNIIAATQDIDKATLSRGLARRRVMDNTTKPIELSGEKSYNRLKKITERLEQGVTGR